MPDLTNPRLKPTEADHNLRRCLSVWKGAVIAAETAANVAEGRAKSVLQALNDLVAAMKAAGKTEVISGGMRVRLDAEGKALLEDFDGVVA